jgi:hypothetical protein
MKQSRYMFYREEQTGEKRLEMKDYVRTPSAPIAEHPSLRPAGP